MLSRQNAATDLDFIPSNSTELRLAVVQMAASISVSDWMFLKMIVEMDRTESWREGGYCNLSNWLDHQCGLGPLGNASGLERHSMYLPRVDAAFRDGQISYSKVRAISRVATKETDRSIANPFNLLMRLWY